MTMAHEPQFTTQKITLVFLAMFRLSTTLISTTLVLVTGAAQVRAHVAPWVKGIWECNDGSNNVRTFLPLNNSLDSFSTIEQRPASSALVYAKQVRREGLVVPW